MKNTAQGPIHRLFGLMLVILTLGLPALASAEDCNPDQHEWSESLYYPAGTVVYHNDSWFESRDVHQGKEPGISFDWRRLHAVPDCSEEQQRPTPFEAEEAEQGLTQAGEDVEVCERPEQWLFAETYAEGDMAGHGGNVWEALEETKGDMPGVKQPPKWRLVEDHCSIQQSRQPVL